MATSSIPGRRGKGVPPPGTLVLFVRHGTTPTTGHVLPGRAPGLHLADVGRAQATVLAERLGSWALSNTAAAKPDHGPTRSPRAKSGPPRPVVSAVYASPLERTRETAAPIARHLGLKVRIDRGLIECDFGEWTGAELKKLAKLPEWSTVQRYPSGFRFPGGESFSGMRARMSDTVATLCERHPGQAIVAVSHADPIKVTVSDALGAHLDLFQRVMVSPCSVTAISYQASGPVVLVVNSTGSLPELGAS